jgi:hypothetical protein
MVLGVWSASLNLSGQFPNERRRNPNARSLFVTSKISRLALMNYLCHSNIAGGSSAWCDRTKLAISVSNRGLLLLLVIGYVCFRNI